MPPARPLIRPLNQDAGLILSAPEANLRELAALDSGRLLFCGHAGASMNPTLHETDLLELARCDAGRLRVGDVVLFVSPAGGEAVVHRIIEVAPGGLRTRGDNNPGPDAWLVQPADVIGKVVAAQRGDRRRALAGGRLGRLTAWLVRRRRTMSKCFLLLHPVYDSLGRSGVLPNLLPAPMRPRAVSFQAGGERQLRLLLGRRVIGQYDMQAGEWRIRPPYRLLVDDRCLPKRP